MTWLESVLIVLADARIPILTRLARRWTRADERDARIWARLLDDDELVALSKTQPGVFGRALRDELLRRGL